MNEDLIIKDDTSIFSKDIKNSLQDIYDQFRALKNRNEYLEEEIKRLKSEAYKDEELSEMRKRYNKMELDYYRGFPISKKEHEKIQKWIDDLIKDDPTLKINSSGRFMYEFYPTSLGTVGTIIDSITHKKFKFKELN